MLSLVLSFAVSFICSFRNGEIDFNDSFLHIDFDDDIDLPSESCAQRQASLGNEAIFTVKPRLVLEVLRRETENQSKMFEKTLRLFDEEASQETVCILREDWEAMEVLPGDLVHITGPRQISDRFFAQMFSKKYFIFRYAVEEMPLSFTLYDL